MMLHTKFNIKASGLVVFDNMIFKICFCFSVAMATRVLHGILFFEQI